MSLKTTNRTGKKRSRLGKWSIPSYTARKGQNRAWTQDPRSLSQFQLLRTMLDLTGDREEALRLVLVLYSETKKHQCASPALSGVNFGWQQCQPEHSRWVKKSERNQGHAKDLGLVCILSVHRTEGRWTGWVFRAFRKSPFFPTQVQNWLRGRPKNSSTRDRFPPPLVLVRWFGGLYAV